MIRALLHTRSAIKTRGRVRQLSSICAHSALDDLYNRFARMNGSFFSNGWGDLELFYTSERARWDWTYAYHEAVLSKTPLANAKLNDKILRQQVDHYRQHNHTTDPHPHTPKPWPPPELRIEWKSAPGTRECRVFEAEIPTPMTGPLYDALPIESRKARIQLLLPPNASLSALNNLRCVLYLPGTGEHGFGMRRMLSKRLVRDGVAALFLGAKLLHVADLLLLGRTTIEESRSLLHWLQQEGFQKLGVAGLSMGGVHASMVAAFHPCPLAAVPLMAPHSAEPVFCDNMLARATAWRELAHRQEELQAGIEPAEPRPRVHTAPDILRIKSMREENARLRLRNVLGTFTDITRLPVPRCPEAAIMVAATRDLYIPQQSPLTLQQAWPGSEIRWVKGGHISSYLVHQPAFRDAVSDALDRLPDSWANSYEHPGPVVPKSTESNHYAVQR